MIEWRAIRCDGSFKGRGSGVCNQLLGRWGAHSVGVWETKCPRCKTLRTVRIDVPARLATT